eukprot:SAG31_NODE_2091_length_6465_cov_2.429626_5_plen_109_part_00
MGLDKLFCFQIVESLKAWDRTYRRLAAGKTKEGLELAVQQMRGQDYAAKGLAHAVNHPMWTQPHERGAMSILQLVLKVGHAQQVRGVPLSFLCNCSRNTGLYSREIRH